MQEKQLSVTLTDRARDYIVENGYDPVYGARPLKRFIQSKVETLLARAIIEDKLKQGDKVVVDSDENGLLLNIQ